MKLLASVCVDRSCTFNGIRTVLSTVMESDPGCVLLLIGSRSGFDLDQLPALFANQPVAVFAAIVPGIVQEQTHFYEGVMALGFTRALHAAVIEDICRPDDQLVEDLMRWCGTTAPAGAIVMLDGQSEGIDDFVSCLYDCLGPSSSVIGAGLGYLDLSSGPCLITASGVYRQAALLLSLPVPVAIGSHHGFKSIAGPFLVTESEGNLIRGINYQSAFPLYRETLEEYLGHSIDLDNLLEVAKNYPLGMLQLDNEFLVRDPLQWQGDAIQCAGSIPENTVVYILHSSATELLEAASLAATELQSELSPIYSDNQGYFAILIDCISRTLYLGDQFEQELQTIKHNLPQGTPMIGVLSLGEIASSIQGAIHFLNKTTVVGGIKR